MKRIPLKEKGLKRVKLKRTMRPGGGGAKGARNERSVAKRLSLWVTHRKRDDVFWRSAGSGSRTTVLRKNKTGTADAHAGDISLTHEAGADLLGFFSIECKHYKETEIQQLIFGKRGWISREWEKHIKTCKGGRDCKEPFFVLRQNLQPELVLTSELGYKALRTGGDLPILATFPPKGMIVVLFRDLLMTQYRPIRDLLRTGLRPIRPRIRLIEEE
jgi:hypothetical protein